jgi:hypothetical protein
MPRRRVMGGLRLSQNLLNFGFTSVLGTIEYPGMSAHFVHVGEPLKYDTNNGMVVVYDEEGRPWITTMDDPRLEYADELGNFANMMRSFGVERGAYVPHSNDGGYYQREVLANLKAGERKIEVPNFTR